MPWKIKTLECYYQNGHLDKILFFSIFVLFCHVFLPSMRSDSSIFYCVIGIPDQGADVANGDEDDDANGGTGGQAVSCYIRKSLVLSTCLSSCSLVIQITTTGGISDECDSNLVLEQSVRCQQAHKS